MSDSLSSAGWTQVADTGLIVNSSGNRGRGYLWELDTGPSPAARTVTITNNSAFGACYSVWSVTGDSPQIKAGQLAVDAYNGTGGSGSLTIGDLGVAATNGALVICVIGANIDTIGPFPTPSGFSVVNATARPSGSHYEAPAVFDRTDFTDVNVATSNINNAANNFGGVLIEFEEAAPPAESAFAILEQGGALLLEQDGVLMTEGL